MTSNSDTPSRETYTKRRRGGIFCSYIIPTIGRPTLDRSIMSILDQEFKNADIEVVVVNDSGRPLARAEWHNSLNVRIINTNRRERSFARNCGAAIAIGDYLAFLDDDDWLLPGALNCFWDLATLEKEADWLYGGIQVIDNQHKILAELNSELRGNCFAQIMGGAWVPIQASIINARTFFNVGGFNPFICGTEDEDLCRRIAYHGTFANTSAVVACLFRGPAWNSSTNYARATEDTQYSRDSVLAKPNSLNRLLTSAHSSYWYGRICRIYLSTMKWNFRHKRLFTGLSRMFHALGSALLSTIHIPSKEFLQGLNAQHAPGTLHFVMKAYEREKAVKGNSQ